MADQKQIQHIHVDQDTMEVIAEQAKDLYAQFGNAITESKGSVDAAALAAMMILQSCKGQNPAAFAVAQMIFEDHVECVEQATGKILKPAGVDVAQAEKDEKGTQA
jgi:hypothetical protein